MQWCLQRRTFKNQVERDVIMSVMNDACMFSAAPEVQIAAFECLVQIATEYYDAWTWWMNGKFWMALVKVRAGN